VGLENESPKKSEEGKPADGKEQEAKNRRQRKRNTNGAGKKYYFG
jgi:hypothetical protein